MRRPAAFAAAVAWAVLLAAAAWAQPTPPTSPGSFLSLGGAVEIAVARHPALRMAAEHVEIAQARLQQARARYYPWVDAYAIQTAGTIRPLSRFNIGGAQNKPTSYVENVGVLGDQLIYDFGHTTNRVRAERFGREAVYGDMLTRKAIVIRDVTQAYLHCLRAQRSVKLREDIIRERGILRDQIGSLYRNQLRSKFDLNLITVELRSAEAELIQAKNELRLAFAQLNQAMGVQGASDYTLEEVEEHAAPAATLEALIEQALGDRPELLSNDNRIRQAEAHLKSARAINHPTISAIGMYGVIHFSDAPLNQYAGSHPGQTNQWWGAAATVSVPIFTGLLLQNRVAEATQHRHKAEQHRVDVANRVRLDVAEAYFAYQTTRQQVGVVQSQAQAAHAAWELASSRYRLGLASIVEVTTAATARLAAEVELSNTQYAVRIALVHLSYATGKGYRQY